MNKFGNVCCMLSTIHLSIKKKRALSYISPSVLTSKIYIYKKNSTQAVGDVETGAPSTRHCSCKVQLDPVANSQKKQLFLNNLQKKPLYP